MNQPSTIQALLQGGPVDGAIRAVECSLDGRPPPLLMIDGGGNVFVGSNDEPAPDEYPTYELEPEPIEAMLWPYRYVGSLKG